jgi:hypothetical protein
MATAFATTAPMPTAEPTAEPTAAPTPTASPIVISSLHVLPSLVVACLGHSFHSTGAMPTTRRSHQAVLLSNHKVLIVGGSAGLTPALKTALIYDPADDAFHSTGSMTYKRALPSAVKLTNGKVLVAGGTDNGTLPGPAELYNPTTGTFSLTGSLHTPRADAGAALLPNGRVLVVGGSNYMGKSLASAEVYNPTTGLFSAIGSMTSARSNPEVTRLADGRILISGGFDNTGSYPTDLKSAEIFNPNTGHFTATGSMTHRRYWHSATLLTNGKVLVTGGTEMGMELSSVEIYNPATGHFTAAAPLHNARVDHIAVRLTDGKVLVAGGFSPGAPPNHNIGSAEIYNPSTGTWAAACGLVSPRSAMTATRLADGRVLVVGGNCEVSDSACAVAEIYS